MKYNIFVQSQSCKKSGVQGSPTGIYNGNIPICTKTSRSHFDMASWAQVAGTGRPKHSSRPRPSSAVKVVSPPPTRTTNIRNCKSPGLDISKLVAVPKISLQPRLAEISPASPPSTITTSIASQHNTTDGSSLTTPSPPKLTSDTPEEKDGPGTPSYEYNVYGKFLVGAVFVR